MNRLIDQADNLRCAYIAQCNEWRYRARNEKYAYEMIRSILGARLAKRLIDNIIALLKKAGYDIFESTKSWQRRVKLVKYTCQPRLLRVELVPHSTT